MANSLLDFVISLVRDPEAAARYAANPAQSIADAHLTDVTSADVNNLIPVVSDSLSMSSPVGGAAGAQVADHGNVWTSGAAAAALDAFAPHPPAGVGHQHGAVGSVINQPAPTGPGDTPTDPRLFRTDPHEPSVLLRGVEGLDPTFDQGGLPADHPGVWDHQVVHPQTVQPDRPDYDIHG
ncbi:Rv0340 family IniB-related protein [Mycobacterium decipiens]|uniref:Uncharacterized protein n=1 Tax=Mycobacterium decipiens TaxID=1430326 RepID=A0A1X2LS91_9MYCO|nr:IniB N-terminal domain-containing protein [Mycobacterium decipiens]OSC38771.1 hypothetical protein B8W66_19405 [Mycobacterium decipiens]